jgi:starch synthase
VLKNVACLLTIHNSDRQGWFPRETVEKLLLPWDVYTPERAEFYGTFDFLKGGIVYSDAITTVSRKYAEEIQTPEYRQRPGRRLARPGAGSSRHSERGRLPGMESGDRQQDRGPLHPGAAGRKAGLPQGPAARLRCFQPAENTPVVGMVSRLATQKGFDLLAQAFDQLVQENMFLVILGTGRTLLREPAARLAGTVPNKVAVAITYDETLAHKVEAGSDMI